MELLTQKAFAELVGVSGPRINKLVKQGRIPTVGTKIPKNEGMKAWEENRVVGFEKAAEAGAKHGGDPRKTKKQVRGYDHDKISDDDDDEITPADKDIGARYNKAKTEEKEWMAKKRELEYMVEKKKYIPISEVKEEAQKLAAMIRQKIISVAPIIAATAENKTSTQIQRIVEIELNEALKDLQKLEV